MKSMKRVAIWISFVFLSLLITGCGKATADVDITERIEQQDTPILTWGVKADTNFLVIIILNLVRLKVLTWILPKPSQMK